MGPPESQILVKTYRPIQSTVPLRISVFLPSDLVDLLPEQLCAVPPALRGNCCSLPGGEHTNEASSGWNRSLFPSSRLHTTRIGSLHPLLLDSSTGSPCLFAPRWLLRQSQTSAIPERHSHPYVSTASIRGQEKAPWNAATHSGYRDAALRTAVA